jgi:hypothetical protein
MSERSNDQPQGDDSAAYERALQREKKDLLGDIEEDRNLTGSTTYETLEEEDRGEGPTRNEGGR